jgi:hypothetical protein
MPAVLLEKLPATMVLLRVNEADATLSPPPVLWLMLPVMVLSSMVVLGPLASMPPPIPMASLLAKVLFTTVSVP